ncbi:MAG: tRNA (adenosine(37)-N6)-threonylcarbamoyltransferase complex dimerization subunit type 1 TsaB [Chloroflexota bacterium]|nr:tRNA (adenosine(37)-N6)-threonylcarbamoyltransferase complex dimerization subunit type 1 TsaB [Chloroflexota bacterium]MDE2969544.1 tRNA (adenosine(37)-N6)-threonylcarbamoyltransferase complex dimerization subunit type 1 TsaB [Chloroflexota bacterium]
MELCIDTATRYAGVALAEAGRIVAEASWHSRNNHTAELAPAVVGLLAETGTDARELTGIVAVIGPGGFSALRVGLGFAKGLAEPLDIPIAPVSALEVEAARHFESEAGPLLPLLEVGRDRVAWCVYERAGDEWWRTTEEQVTTVAEMVSAAPSDAVYCGEGAWHTAERLRELAADARIIALEPPTRSLAVLAALGHSALASGGVPERQTLEPNYLRPPSITMPAGRGTPPST